MRQSLRTFAALWLLFSCLVTPAFADPDNTVMQNAAVATGAGTAVDLTGSWSGVMMQIKGITSATVTFQATINGTDWPAVQGTNTSNGAIATTATADGLYFVPAAAYGQIRANITTWASGTITITGRRTSSPVGNSQAAIGGTVTATITGTAGAQNGPVTLLASTTDAVAHTVTGAGVTGLGAYKQIEVLLNVTAAAAASGDTLDVYVDFSPDSGTTWRNAIHYTQVLGNGGAVSFWADLDPAGAAGTSVINVTSDAAAGSVRPAVFDDRLRVRYTIVDGGAHGQSFTFSVLAYGKS